MYHLNWFKNIFIVNISGENELEEQTFTLNWARIFLSSANYSITEEDKFLEVTLKRRGYLGETSFVSKFDDGQSPQNHFAFRS